VRPRFQHHVFIMPGLDPGILAFATRKRMAVSGTAMMNEF
jgi:hypothetical protein